MSPTPKKRVAIYARVSTFDKGQDPETQLLQLREYAQRRSFDVADEYVDHATGTNEDRANYQRLLDDVRKRKVDVVLVGLGALASRLVCPASSHPDKRQLEPQLERNWIEP